MDEPRTDGERPLIAFSRRTRAGGRTYYDNVYATSLEEAYSLYGTSASEDAEIDIIEASEEDLARGELGLSWD
ncbi:hypothetical protein [Thermomonospora cellulosilytica]|uniref:Uncharacterized protein n=1 Tax=Thermomonospora cellulosilytica TaxID=1411118 RepID=A0A7W3N5L2_9ACTN|nr:hypothetical protein [Thermomonospora cellulosilytica]MBA9007897.1 hypothetical protein [Thermomonospora cellulosilytica]